MLCSLDSTGICVPGLDVSSVVVEYFEVVRVVGASSNDGFQNSLGLSSVPRQQKLVHHSLELADADRLHIRYCMHAVGWRWIVFLIGVLHTILISMGFGI